MHDAALVKKAIDKAFRQSIQDHFKTSVSQGIEADITIGLAHIKDRFKNGLKHRLEAYEMAIAVVDEVMGNDEAVLRHTRSQ